MLRHLNLRRVHLALLILAFAATAADAEWLPLAGQAEGAAPIVTTHDVGGVLTVEIVVPGCDATTVVFDGTTYSRVTMPDCALLQQAGYPEVPLLPVTLQIPGAGDPHIEILSIEERDLAVAPVVPSLGHLTRDIDAAALTPRPASVYTAGGVWPANSTELGRPFAIRHRRGVTVEVHPVRWDAGRGVMVGISRLVLAVHVEGSAGVNAVAADKAVQDGLFDDVYAGLFANAAAADKDAGFRGPTSSHRMLILCGNDLTGAMQPFATWKRQRGFEVEVLSMNDVGGTVLGIREAIAARYNETTGLAYLILVGDVEQVPTIAGGFQGADSDGTYAMVDGNDFYADFLVSRLPARDATEASSMVAKIVGYERDPEAAGAWYTKAVGVASNEGVPSDFARAELLRDDLIGFGFSDVSRVYQGFGGSTADIVAAVTSGVSLINYLGHGSPTGWTSVPFSTTNVQALANGRCLPWVIDISCSTGDFSRADCFAEAWLRAGTSARPAGAVGMVAASTSTPWVPPCVMQTEIIDRLVSEDTVELGALYVAGMARVLCVYEGLAVAQQMAEQFNLFGDCSIVVRKRAPRSLVVNHSGTILPDARIWTAQVTGVAGAMLTLTSGNELVARTLAGDDGRATLALARAAVGGESLVLTVTATDATPVVVSVPVLEAAVPVEDVLVAGPRLVGNFPNPCNPRTAIVFELPAAELVSLRIYDVRGNLVRDLVHETRPAGRQDMAWDGADENGRAMASGTYFARLTAGAEVSTRPLTVVR
jgi:hypothetical protein